MTLHVSRSEVYQALSQVRHPEIQSRNLVALGMILEVTGECFRDRVEELKKQIADLKERWPAHSVPAAMMEQLDELEEKLRREWNARARFETGVNRKLSCYGKDRHGACPACGTSVAGVWAG